MTDTRFSVNSVYNDNAKHFSGGKGAQKQQNGSKTVVEPGAKQ